MLSPSDYPFTSVPRFSFYKAPVRNTIPYKHITLRDAYNYITGNYARDRTEALRLISDIKEAREFKAKNFDYCTFSGIFSYRNEKALIEKALEECAGNRSRAAEKLNISRRTLQRKIKIFGLE